MTRPVGAILTGGQSRRMQEPKPGVILADGRTMLAHVIENLRPVCSEIILLGDWPNADVPEDTTLLHDTRSGLGPLGGMATLLASGKAERYLVLSCDQPLLKPVLLKTLAANTPASALGFFCDITDASQMQPLDPFPGIYPAGWQHDVTQALANATRGKRLSIRDCIRQSDMPVHWEALRNPSDIRQLTSLNTPADLRLIP